MRTGRAELIKPLWKVPHLALLRSWRTVLVAVVLGVAGLHYLVPTYEVDGLSMWPGLRPHDWVVVSTLAYASALPARGDVVIIHPPTDPQVSYIKRIIGVAGDSIILTGASVAIGNHTLREPYVASPGMSPPTLPAVRKRSFTLGPDQYFVLRDNRLHSQDSRAFGPISRHDIVGKVEWVIWPLDDFQALPSYTSVFTISAPEIGR